MLDLPATKAELQDAKERLGITGNEEITSFELCHCEYDWLEPHLSENADLLKLNLLAIQMEGHIKEDMDVFEAMVKIETRRGSGQPIPLPRLINLSFSTYNCHVAGGVTNDAQLGKFLLENDFLQDEDAAALQKRIDSGQSVDELYALFGKEHRNSEGGVFTGTGRYVEFDGCANEVHIPGDDVMSGPEISMEMGC
jgi:hypothetical protein